MWARNNSGGLEIVHTDPEGKWADGGGFVKVDDSIKPFLTTDYKEENGAIVPPELDYLKSQLKRLLDKRCEATKSQGVLLEDGTLIPTDPLSRARAMDLYRLIKDGIIVSGNLKLGDKEWLTVDAVNSLMIAKEIGEHIAACYAIERSHSENIDNLNTLGELLSYDFNTGWPL